MSYQILSYERIDHIEVIRITSPSDTRAEMEHLANEVADVCSEITLDKDIRVIVVTGTGEKAFAIGEDLTPQVSETKQERGTGFCSIAEPIAKLNQPVIAAINGDAIGLGLELTLACDIRISEEGSRFGLPQVSKGNIPWDGGTQRLSRLVGRSKALEMLLTGDLIGAQEAYRIGLVNKVASPGELMTAALDVAREVASKGPITLRYAKEAIHDGMDLTLEQGLRLEADLYFLLHTTRDRTEGIRAFQQKRSPQFEGE
jgi:enoyl-CoA hydratase